MYIDAFISVNGHCTCSDGSVLCRAGKQCLVEFLHTRLMAYKLYSIVIGCWGTLYGLLAHHKVLWYTVECYVTPWRVVLQHYS